MSATSGIVVADDLSRGFAAAITVGDVRFIKAIIRNESISVESIVNVEADLISDLAILPSILEDDIPAYILAKLDHASSAWLAISYVPDNAKVREKMLYASSRAALTKALGSGYFVDSLFATSKSDLTPEAYEAHQAHIAAPKPLSSKEKELEEIKAAERDITPMEGSRRRQNHLGEQPGLPWDPAVANAIEQFPQKDESYLMVMSITSETLELKTFTPTSPNQIGSILPVSEAAYALYLWCHTVDQVVQKDLVFIYSCPSGSNVKTRMIYSSGVNGFLFSAKQILGDTVNVIKRLETSEPSEINEKYLSYELGMESIVNPADISETSKPFARPRGPPRKK